MKSKIYLTLITALTATAVLAQDNVTPQPTAPAAPANTTITQPETPTAPTSAPEAKPKATKKKKSAKSTKTTTKASDSTGAGKLVYNPPASATVKQEAVNVRGQASFIGEVITHLKKGETVTVLEEITLKKPKKDEPAKWAKISMPTNTPVWVSGELIDSATMTASKNVSVRGGPGENYSRVAILPKGTAVKEIRKNKGWIEIETPANAVGFVAADFLDIQPATTAPAVAANTPEAEAPAPVPTPEPTAVQPQTAPVAANPNEQPTPSTPANPGEPIATTPAPAPAPAPAPEVSNEPPPKRVVTREGTVKKARNIQSPTDYELHDARTGETIEYLMSATANKTLKPYLGMRVLITGPEMLDARWKNTPIVEVESIELP
jgi:uncharacterized protein YgiM (DUF1202 family)